MALAEMIEAVTATRAELARVNTRIDELTAERQRTVNAPPHTDEIIAAFRRGLDASAGEYQRQLAAFLTGTYLDATGGAVASVNGSPQLLTTEATKPDREALMSRSMRGDVQALSTAALTYFLRDVLAAELPALVNQLCPAARAGLRNVEREAVLQMIDAELAKLTTESGQLAAELGAARAAVNGSAR